MITKRKLLDHYKSQVAIAELFGISKQAVSAWPLDEPIPEAQELRLKYELAPHLFTPSAPESPQNDDEAAA